MVLNNDKKVSHIGSRKCLLGTVLLVIIFLRGKLSEGFGDDVKDLFLVLLAEAFFHVFDDRIEDRNVGGANVEKHDEFSLADLISP